MEISTINKLCSYFHSYLFIGIILLHGNILLAGNPDGDLRIEIITGYNLIVDSNVESSSAYSPHILLHCSKNLQ